MTEVGVQKTSVPPADRLHHVKGDPKPHQVQLSYRGDSESKTIGKQKHCHTQKCVDSPSYLLQRCLVQMLGSTVSPILCYLQLRIYCRLHTPAKKGMQFHAFIPDTAVIGGFQRDNQLSSKYFTITVHMVIANGSFQQIYSDRGAEDTLGMSRQVRRGSGVEQTDSKLNHTALVSISFGL